MEEAIERVVNGGDTRNRQENGQVINETQGEQERRVGSMEREEEVENLTRQVDEIIAMLEVEGYIDLPQETDEPRVEQEAELSCEGDPEFTMELTVDNGESYEPNYY